MKPLLRDLLAIALVAIATLIIVGAPLMLVLAMWAGI